MFKNIRMFEGGEIHVAALTSVYATHKISTIFVLTVRIITWALSSKNGAPDDDDPTACAFLACTSQL